MFISSHSEIECLGDGTTLLRGDFDISAFNDRLYTTFGVPFPPEVRASAPKRRSEFLAGRILAKRALLALGSNSTDVAIGDNRAPVWPAGFTGSISHTHGSAVALVAARDDYLIGVDLESILPNEAISSVAGQVLTLSEQSLLDATPDYYVRNLTLAFSAKESLFKALFPAAKCFFGFETAELVDLPMPRAMTLVLTRDLPGGFTAGSHFNLNWRMCGREILTWIVSPQRGSV